LKKLFFAFAFILSALPIVLQALQATPALRLEITGVNPSELPTVTVTANVYDALGQPVRGLTAADFSLFGALEDSAEIVSVENVTDDNLPFATVLIVDVSDSMTGLPIERAQEAARVFVNSIGAADPVALVTFGSQIRLVQDYSTDKAALLSAIDSLRTGGQTALYQGAYEAIELAAISPTPRRAAILLSDGAEYGGISRVGRQDVYQQALARGVPVYTIGLGYGTDRGFLQTLSDGTNARFYESPDPDQLAQIYSDLAALLRSQYVITLSADLPFDGSEYDLGLQVVSGEQTASANAVLRAPIPVPIVRLSDLPNEPIDVPTTVTAEVLADDPLSGLTFAVGDQAVTVTTAPYTFTIDPAAYLPGIYMLTVEAADENGDVGTAEAPLTVAALPSIVTISPDLTALGELDEPTTVTVSVSGQTPATSIEYSAIGRTFAGGQFLSLEGENTFTLDPQTLNAGDNQLTLRVTNESGITSTTGFPFRVAQLPPVIAIDGVQEGQLVDMSIPIEVGVVGQTSSISITASIGALTLEPDQIEQGDHTTAAVFTLNPMEIAPGTQPLLISATDQNDQTGTQQVNLTIAALPPIILVSGLEEGAVLAEDTRVDLDFISQTSIVHVALFLNETELADQVSAPFGTTLNLLEIRPGEHTLGITVDNASGQHSSLDIHFSVPEGPSLTATALAPTPTPSPTETPDAGATRAQQGTLSAVRTTTAEAIDAQTATQERLQGATANANATGTAIRTTATAAALAAADAALQATSQAAALATQNALSTATLRAQAATNANATASANAQATDTVLQATQEARASATAAAQSTENANVSATALQATQEARASATTAAQSTENANVSATALQATQEARASATTAAQGTENANVSATALQATQEARASATAAAQGTENANVSATAAAQATNQAQATATSNARATSQAAAQQQAQESTRSALATSNMQARIDATQTADVRATRSADLAATQAANASATARAAAAQATSLAQTNATATELAQLLATAAALAEDTATQSALQTQQAVAQATSNAQATRSRNATATTIVQLNMTVQAQLEQTREANATATAESQAAQAFNETVTAQQQATIDTQLAAVGATTPPADTPTAEVSTAVAQALETSTARPTPTIQPTLTLIETESPPSQGDNIPTILIGLFVVIVLIVILLILTSRRRRLR
jgi:VWFA-related protein